MAGTSYDVVIIGGGPAGMAAASASAGKNARVLLIDSSSTLGGHFYKEFPPTFKGPLSRLDAGHNKEYLSRLEALSRAGLDIFYETNVWGIFQGCEKSFGNPRGTTECPQDPVFTLNLDGLDSNPAAVQARALILAPGAYDRPIPFPGWTLPGVITPGAVQMSLKKQGLVPGRRILVAGTGPLQMAVAANLAELGGRVVGLIDTCSAGEKAGQLPPAMWGQWSRISEVSSYFLSLLKHRVPVKFNRAVLRAIGTNEEGVQAAVTGRIDPAGNVIPGTEQQMDVDLICVAYGFAPSVELLLHLGCEHEYLPETGLYYPKYDNHMQTTMRHVFVAGDVTGIGGKALADLQGQIAGISALQVLGMVPESEALAVRSKLQPKIRRERRFARWLWQRYPIKPGLFNLAEDDTIVCRCDSVTAGQIRKSYDQGARDLRGIKLRTHMGMGICQGRYCAGNAAIIFAHQAGSPTMAIGTRPVRPPIVPVRIENIHE